MDHRTQISRQLRSVSWFAPAVFGVAWWSVSADIGAALEGTLVCVAAFALAVSSVCDTRSKRIPNWVTYPAILWCLALNAIASLTGTQSELTVGIAESLLGTMVCGGVLLLFYSSGSIGAGDVKLAGFVGSFLGVTTGLISLMWCIIFAGIFCLGWMIYSVGILAVIRSCFDRAIRLFCPAWIPRTSSQQFSFLSQSLPMAAFFSAGVLWVLSQGAVSWLV